MRRGTNAQPSARANGAPKIKPRASKPAAHTCSTSSRAAIVSCNSLNKRALQLAFLLKLARPAWTPSQVLQRLPRYTTAVVIELLLMTV